MARIVFADLEADSLGTNPRLQQLLGDPGRQRVVENRFARELDENEIAGVPLAEGDRGVDDPPIDGAEQLVARCGRDEICRRDFVALTVDHSEQGVVDSSGLTAQVRDVHVDEPKTVIDQGRLDLPDPDIVGALQQRARIRGLLDDDFIAAFLPAILGCLAGASDQVFSEVRALADLGDADRARQRQRPVGDLEQMLGNRGNHLLAPTPNLIDRGAFEDERENRAAEAPRDIAWVEGLADQFGQSGQQVFARNRAERALDLGELVGSNDDQGARAVRGAIEQLFGEQLEEVPPMQKTSHRIGREHAVDQGLACLFRFGRFGREFAADAQFGCRLTIMARWMQLDLQGNRCPVAERGFQVERLAIPLVAPDADQRALEHVAALRREVVHQRPVRCVDVRVRKDVRP